MNKLDLPYFKTNIEKFFNSNWFFLIVGVIIITTWWTDHAVVGIVLLLAAFGLILVCSKNTMPAVTVLLCIYFTFSPSYSSLKGNEWMIALLAIPLTAIVIHCIVYKPKLKIRGYGVAMALVTLPWLLQGIGRRIKYCVTDYFSPTFVWVAYIIVAGLGALYFLLYLFFDATCKSEKGEKGEFLEYMCKLMIFTAIVITAQCFVVIGRLLINTPFDTLVTMLGNGAKPLNLGWGTCNNVAAYFSLTVPITGYFALKKGKLAPVYFFFMLLQYVLILFTFSRGPMIFVTAALPVIIVYLFVKGDKKHRIAFGIVLAVCAIAAAVVLYVLKDMTVAVVNRLLAKGLDDSGRFTIWRNAVDVFTEFPVLGGGMDIFYFTDTAPWSLFFNRPGIPRWFHSTLFQTMAAFGTLGLIAYAYQFLYRYTLAVRRFKDVRRMSILAAMLLFDAYGMIDINFFAPMLYFIVMLLTLAIDKDDEYKPVKFLTCWFPKRLKAWLDKNRSIALVTATADGICGAEVTENGENNADTAEVANNAEDFATEDGANTADEEDLSAKAADDTPQEDAPNNGDNNL